MAGSHLPLQYVLAGIVVVLHASAACAGPASSSVSAGGNGEACSGPVLQQSCHWLTVDASKRAYEVVGHWPPLSSGHLPSVQLPTNTTKTPSTLPGMSLSLQRLVLTNVAVADPGADSLPRLWPLSMFTAVGANLTLTDVRFVLSGKDFKAYLSFFQGLPQPPNVFFTDGISFIQIPEWNDSSTVLRSVTLLGPSCSSGAGSESFLQPAASASLGHNSSCNVHTAVNSTVIPTLQAVGSVVTEAPLLVLLLSNATIGIGLEPWAINIQRPVVIAGLFGVPTSIDFGMVVNQINATAKGAKVIWQSLYLENLSPADGLAATMAPPYSGAVSANVYPVYCNRSRQVCLNLYNTTSDLASSEEMDYVTFMYSMFNSPLPNMRTITDFYHTELRVTIIDMGPGPGGAGMTLYNMSCSAWRIHDSVFTDQPILRIARKLPFPDGRPLVTTATKAAPWVQGVDNCESMQAAMLAPSEEDRLHVWMLLGNVTINPASDATCWKARSVQYTTQVYGQAHHDGVQHTGSGMELPAPKPGAPAPYAAINPTFDMFVLDWNHERSALQLRDGAGEKFLQIQNVTLVRLPQGPDAAKAAGMRTGQGGDGPTPPDVWTILMWPVTRSWQGSPLYLSDVQLLVPQPEYDFVRQTAQTSGSFVVQLADTVGLAFNDLTIVGNAIKIGTLQGPGVLGHNIWLLPDPAAPQSMRGGYTWPLGVTAAPTLSEATDGSRFSNRVSKTAVAVGASVGGLVLLAILGLAYWWWLRRKQLRRQQFLISSKPNSSLQCSECGSGSAAANLDASSGQFVGIDVAKLKDKAVDALPGKRQIVHQQHCVGSTDQLLQAELSRATASCSSDGRVSNLWSPATCTDTASNSVASGLQRFKTAINSTTMQLMERRMAGGTAVVGSTASSGSGSHMAGTNAGAAGSTGRAPAANTRQLVNGQPTSPGSLPPTAAQPSNLQLVEVLGQGSFGCVYLGVWHGKRVAVKVMQLPANALLGPHEPQQAVGQSHRRSSKRQGNHAPHMAIMETVVSSTMSHPNVVQVFTYMLNPLTVEVGSQPDDDQESHPKHGLPGRKDLSGWELRLVMEYCDQGTLRESLDHRLLSCDDSSPYLLPSIVLSLAHDVAAAMLHLHSEGVVHGDLKAANVLLTNAGDDPGNVWKATLGHRVTAKVADFGLAMPLDPNETHATMAARGTPTHMSPELFISGHVSKASDVYAYGILLYEIITGQRAYAGVPIPLLPHEVARQGLRPTWPANVPASFRDLQKLAEASWSPNPQDRPSFQLVFNVLDALQNGRQPPPLALPQQQCDPNADPEAGHESAGMQLGFRSQEQLQVVQHQLEQRFGAVVGGRQLPGGAAAAGKDMVWSEVK